MPGQRSDLAVHVLLCIMESDESLTLTTDINDLSVGEIMNQWPETIGVFMSFQLHCVGCPIAMLHRVEDAAREHSVHHEALLDALKLVVAG